VILEFWGIRKKGISRGRGTVGKVFGERSEKFLENGRKSFRASGKSFWSVKGKIFFRGFAGSEDGRFGDGKVFGERSARWAKKFLADEGSEFFRELTVAELGERSRATTEGIFSDKVEDGGAFFSEGFLGAGGEKMCLRLIWS